MQDSSEQNYYIPDFSRGFAEPRGALSFSLYLCVCVSVVACLTTLQWFCCVAYFQNLSETQMGQKTDKRKNEQTNRQTDRRQESNLVNFSL